jgi:hypothetical protein
MGIYYFSSRDLLNVMIQEELEGQASGEGRRDTRGSVVRRRGNIAQAEMIERCRDTRRRYPKHVVMWARRDVHSWRCGDNTVSTLSCY